MSSALLVDPDTADRAEELRLKMAEIRCTLRDRATEAAEDARQHTDWRFLVSSYPWLSVSVSAVLGYVLVPGRRRTVRRAAQQMVGSEETPAKKSAFWMLLGLALPVIQGLATRRAIAFLDTMLPDVPGPATVQPPPENSLHRKPR